ncbi:MAG: hypothetical protein EXS76_02075 [Nitrosarchaeum sp.]|nr:hypothetical protein [Nitrosarchaeum sp.]
MSIQILQYEFLGPIKLQEWGPSMEKVVYLIMSRQKDSFNIIYAGDCEQTSDEKFFTSNSSFKCWTEKSGSEKSLYLAILPLFESGNDERKKILDKILVHYRPICNLGINYDVKPDYKIRSKPDLQNTSKTPCPCCGSEMKVDKVLETTTIIRCIECGLSDTRLNS